MGFKIFLFLALLFISTISARDNQLAHEMKLKFDMKEKQLEQISKDLLKSYMAKELEDRLEEQKAELVESRKTVEQIKKELTKQMIKIEEDKINNNMAYDEIAELKIQSQVAKERELKWKEAAHQVLLMEKDKESAINDSPPRFSEGSASIVQDLKNNIETPEDFINSFNVLHKELLRKQLDSNNINDNSIINNNNNIISNENGNVNKESIESKLKALGIPSLSD